MKHIKVRQINGVWYPINNYSIRLIAKTGLKYNKGGFLMLNVLANHLALYNIAITAVPN